MNALRCIGTGLVLAWSVTSTAPAQDTTVVQDTTSPGPRRGSALLPTYPLQTPAGPLAPGSRYVFTRDSVRWSTAHTLADLLASIPGVYVARAGWIGVPEYVQYGGRGGSALELYWDGVPLYPMGGDSLFSDPGTIYLRFFRRIDVEVLPTLLRVYLMTERHDDAPPRTLVRAAPGAFNTATYTGLFQKRWRSGLNLDVAAQFVGTDGGSGAGRSDQLFDIWGKVGWIPSDRVMVSYQIRRQHQERDAITAGGGGAGVPDRAGDRTDAIFSLVTTPGGEGLGLTSEMGLAVSSWAADSGRVEPEQTLRQAYLGLGFVARSWSANVRTTVADARTPLRLDGRVGWIPFPGLAISGDAQVLQLDGDRTSRRAHVSAALYRGPFALVGEAQRGSWVQAPALGADTAIATEDEAIRFHLTSRLLTGHIGITRRSAFAPLAYPELALLPAFSPSERATYVVTSVELRPTRAITLAGWYSNPIDGAAPDLLPPTLSRAQISFRSKFLRTFRSRAFDFKLQVAMESWSTGTAGLDASGSPVALPGATFVEYHVAIELVGFTAFWNLRNARLTDASYVPGLNYPKNGQTFGVTWVFAN